MLAHDLSHDLASGLADELAATSLHGILGANLVDYWRSEDAVLVSGAADSVTGRVGGYTLSAVDVAHRMVWTPANAALGGHPSLGGTVAGAQRLINSALPNIIAAGNIPFMFAVLVFTDFASATEQVPMTMGSAGWTLQPRKSAGNLARGVCFDSGIGQGVVNGPAIANDGQAHLIGALAVNPGVYVWWDNVMYTAFFNANPLSCDNVTEVGIGGTGQELALAGVCTTNPTAGELAALYAWLKPQYNLV